MTWQEIAQNLVHVGAILYIVGFLFRDQIMLRSFAIAGDIAYVVYYFYISEQPLWGAIFWNIPNLIVNLAMIGMILRDRRSTSFDENELKLFRCLKNLSPSDFRKIVRLGKWNRPSAEVPLSTEGQPLHTLHYVVEGDVAIDKGGRKIPTLPGLFIGEVAFLKQRPASATVKVAPGALYISWPHDKLLQMQARNDGLRNAINSMLSADMAEKVARS